MAFALADDTHSDFRCSFSVYRPDISCGFTCGKFAKENYVLTLNECMRDIKDHLRSLRIPVGSTDGNGFTIVESMSEADLICRRAGLFQTNLELTSCPLHRCQLGIQFRQRKTCKHPQHVGNGKVFRGVSAVHSHYLIQTYGVLVPVGSGICYKCYRNLCDESKPPLLETHNQPQEAVYTVEHNEKEHTAMQGISQHLSHLSCTYEEKLDCDSNRLQYDQDDVLSATTDGNSQQFTVDSDSQAMSLNSSQISSWSDDDQKDDIPLESVNKIISLISKGHISPLKYKVRSDISNLHPSSKRMLKRKATSVIEALMDCFAPGQGKDLMKMISIGNTITEKDQPADLKATIIKLYMNSDDCNMKKQMLSLLARDFTKNQLQQMIPGLTVYSIDQARLHATVYGEGVTLPKQSKKHRQRMDQGKLSHALDFFFSPLFHQVSSYGTKEMKLENGEKVVIPEVVRTVCHSNMVLMYESFCQETAFVPLSRSSLFEILKVSTASKRASLKGLDNIAADGSSSFDTLDQIIKQLKPYLKEPEMQENLSRIMSNLHASKLYIKTDFKMHISLTDPCSDHCIKFALSDPADASLRMECAHQHDMTCDRCELFSECIVSLKKLIADQIDISTELKGELLNDIEVAESYVTSWKQHLVRSSNQDLGRKQILDSLKPNEVLIIMDWAMKFLPLSFREKQSDWYAQKGINWHVCVCIFKDDNQNLKHRTFAHMFDYVKQDWFAVVSILEHTLKTLKVQLPTITSAYLRSDNAGCYHCGNTWLSLEGISDRTGITIQRYDFSESQDGKSYCDAKIAHLRGKIRQHVAAGSNVKTAIEMKEAVDALDGVVGCQAAHVEVNAQRSMEANQRKNVWKGITKISNIQLRGKEIITWKAFNIGEGNVMSSQHLRKMCPSPLASTDLIVHKNFTLPKKTDGEIKYQKEDTECASSSVPVNDPMQLPADVDQHEFGQPSYFSCIEPGCSRVFTTYSGLEGHILTGNHKLSLNKISSFDDIKIKWKDSCFKIAEHSTNFRNSPLNHGTSSSQMGWALKKDRKNQRFGEKVRTYLKGIFEAGETTGRKASAQDVSKNMRVCCSEGGEKMFRPEECLQPSQIASYFSRLALLSRAPKQVTMEDEDLSSALDMIDTIEALNVINDQ